MQRLVGRVVLPRSEVTRTVGFFVATLRGSYIDRLTYLPESQVVLFSPLAGLSFLWLASGSRRSCWWDIPALSLCQMLRAAATLTGPDLAKATTTTIRRKLITVPARITTAARRVSLNLPTAWPWETAWLRIFTHGCGPPAAAPN